MAIDVESKRASETPMKLDSTVVKAIAIDLGFDWAGIAPAVSPPGYPRFLEWLEADRHAGMDYMERLAAARVHPENVLEGVRSIVVVALVYGGGGESENADPRFGKTARYARGIDYHQVFWKRLDVLLERIRAIDPSVRGRSACDTAPLLERDFAALAGLGWIGKNTMMISKKLGSFTLLGGLLLDLELEPDARHETNHCGTCTRCLDACPTSAFDGAYRLDANRCISYWTIEHRGTIAEEFADRLDGWLFGCDICQDVCPWNRKAPRGKTPELSAGDEWVNVDLIELLEADDEAISRRLRGTAFKRAKRSGLLRNAALILGTRGVVEAIPALAARTLDRDPVVREAAVWAIERIESVDPQPQ